MQVELSSEAESSTRTVKEGASQPGSFAGGAAGPLQVGSSRPGLLSRTTPLRPLISPIFSAARPGMPSHSSPATSVGDGSSDGDTCTASVFTLSVITPSFRLDGELVSAAKGGGTTRGARQDVRGGSNTWKRRTAAYAHLDRSAARRASSSRGPRSTPRFRLSLS